MILFLLVPSTVINLCEEETAGEDMIEWNFIFPVYKYTNTNLSYRGALGLGGAHNSEFVRISECIINT